jgi:serine protease Do
LLAVVMTATVGSYPYLQHSAIAARAVLAPVKGTQVSPPASAAAPVDFSTIVDRYGPAVVNFSVTTPEQQASAPAPESIDADDPFLQIFKQFAPAPNHSNLF